MTTKQDITDRLDDLETAAYSDEWWQQDSSFTQVLGIVHDATNEIKDLRDDLTDCKERATRAEQTVRELLDRLADVRRGIGDLDYVLEGPMLHETFWATDDSAPAPCELWRHARDWTPERDYMTAVRDLLAMTAVEGDPVEACKAAAFEAISRAWAIYANELAPYRPYRMAPASAIEYGIAARDLKLKRASTLLARFVAALDREIASRSVVSTDLH